MAPNSSPRGWLPEEWPVQVLPSNVQVAVSVLPTCGPTMDTIWPKSTTCFVAASYAIAPPNRGAGGGLDGWSCAQARPSQVQVCVSWLVPSGWASISMTSRPSAGSSASSGPTVADGLADGWGLVHVLPSQVQVSPIAASPPLGPATVD